MRDLGVCTCGASGRVRPGAAADQSAPNDLLKTARGRSERRRSQLDLSRTALAAVHRAKSGSTWRFALDNGPSPLTDGSCLPTAPESRNRQDTPILRYRARESVQ